MMLRLSLLALLLGLISIVATAQSVPSGVQEVRDRYYRTNGAEVTLRKEVIDGRDFYFEGEALRKVIVTTDNRREEYYFDQAYIQRHAYFVYIVETGGGQTYEHRYYFVPEDELVRYVDAEGEVIEGEALYDYCADKKYQIAKSQDELIRLNNHQFYATQPTRQQWVATAEAARAALDDLELTEVVEKDVFVEEESYIESESRFEDAQGRVRKTTTYSGGDHGGYGETRYYDEAGDLICHVEGEYMFYSGNVETRHYYRDGKVVATVRYRLKPGYDFACDDGFDYTWLGEVVP